MGTPGGPAEPAPGSDSALGAEALVWRQRAGDAMSAGGDGGLAERMRAAVSETVTVGAARLRTVSAPVLVGVLAASAVAPVIAVVGAGVGAAAVAVAGVMGSVGANVLTNVLTDVIGRLRAANGGGEPSSMQVQQALADRVAAVFASADPAGRQLRAEVVGLFRGG